MADYYTYFSFIFPMSPAHGAWLCSLHAGTCRLCADQHGAEELNREAFVSSPVSDNVAGAAQSASELVSRFSDYSVDGTIVRYNQSAEVVWIRSDDGMGVYHYAAALVQKALQQFILDEVVTFEWALTCSAPRPDGFGGGAAVVHRSNIYIFDTYRLVKEAVGQVLDNPNAPFCLTVAPCRDHISEDQPM